MDEVLFHVSQKFEALQVHLYSGAQQGRLVLHNYADQAQEFAVAVWTGSRAIQLQDGVNRLIEWIIESTNELKEVSIATFQQCFARLTQHLTQDMTRTSLYFGCVGFVVGGVVGVTVGLSWYKTPPRTQLMKAVVCTSYSGCDAVCMVDNIPVPIITSPYDVLIQVKAASVDPVDIQICTGYGRLVRRQFNRHNKNMPNEFPVVLGRDCSGVVLEIGPRVTRVELNDEVWLSVPHWAQGTMCELIVVNESVLAKKPRAVGFETAASLPYAGTVAWNAMVSQAGLTSKTTHGKRILIHNGCSAVGCVLLQLARLWGAAHVTATCHMRATPVAQALGADHVITFETGDIESQLAAAGKYHAVFNTMGWVAHSHCQQFCLKEGIVVTTEAPDIISDGFGCILGSFYTLWSQAKYSVLSIFGISRSIPAYPSVLDTLCGLIEDGSLQPVVDKIYSPQDCELAFQHVDSSEAIGKTVIRFRSRNLSKSRSNSHSKKSFEGNPSV